MGGEARVPRATPSSEERSPGTSAAGAAANAVRSRRDPRAGDASVV